MTQAEMNQGLAWCLFAAGALLSLLNFHLSFVRPVVVRRRGREERFISGFPLIGSLMLVASAFLFPVGSMFRPAALAIALLDTGGIHWFCGVMLYQWLRGRGGKG